MEPSSAAHTMLPPSAPASTMLPPSQKPPRSGQGSQHTQKLQSQGDEAAHGTAEKQNQAASTDETTSDDTGSCFDSDPGEPQDKIEDFDWNDLQHRYHDKITEVNDTERRIMEEFNGLCDYFSVWAQTGSAHEVDRSFKRLQTQMTLVQHHEDELEQKRLHYIKVVNAFKSALDLLST